MGLKLNLGTWEVVSIFDDAILRRPEVEVKEEKGELPSTPEDDEVYSDIAGYVQAEHRDWEKYLVIAEGELPVVFEVDTLTLKEREMVNDGMTLTYTDDGATMGAYSGKRYARAFAYGVKGWKNLDLQYSRVLGKISPKRMEVLGKACHRTVFEIGKLILDGSVLSGESKN